MLNRIKHINFMQLFFLRVTVFPFFGVQDFDLDMPFVFMRCDKPSLKSLPNRHTECILFSVKVPVWHFLIGTFKKTIPKYEMLNVSWLHWHLKWNLHLVRKSRCWNRLLFTNLPFFSALNFGSFPYVATGICIALEHLRKKIEISGEKIKAAKQKEEQAKKVLQSTICSC